MKKTFLALLIILSMANACLAIELTLKDSIDIALKKNPQVLAAKEQVNAANARLGQALGNFMPDVTFGGSQGLLYNQPQAVTLPAALGGGKFTLYPDQAASLTSYNFSLQQPLFLGGKLIQAYSIARLSLDAAKKTLEKTQTDTSFNVTSSFYNVMKAQKGLAVIKDTAANLKRNLTLTKAFYDSGIGSTVDLLRAESQLASIQINRIQAENSLKLAHLSFENTLGQSFKEGVTLKEEKLDSALTLNASPEVLLDVAYKNRPDWLAYKFGLQAAEDALKIAYSGYLPTIAYTYSKGRTQTDYSAGSSYNSNLGNWRSMVVASWTLFNGFETFNTVNEAQAKVNEAKAQEQALQDGIKLDVNSSYFTLQSNQQRVLAAQVAADLANRALKSVELSYKSRIASEQLYFDTLASNVSAQLALWSAKYDYEIARAAMNRAVGKTVI